MALEVRQQMEGIITMITGVEQSTIDNFEFQVGKTPLTSIQYPFATVVFYCIGIPLLQRFMKGRASPPLKFILIVHNVFLSITSFFIAIYLIVTLLTIKHENNYNFYPNIFCALNHFEQVGQLQFIYYVNYLLKFYEVKYHFICE